MAEPANFDTRWDALSAEAAAIGLPRRWPAAFRDSHGPAFNPRSAYAQHHASRGCDAGAHTHIDALAAGCTERDARVAAR